MAVQQLPASERSSASRPRTFLRIRHPASESGNEPQCPLASPLVHCQQCLYNQAMTDTHWRSTTILSVRKGGKVVVAGDGQVTMGQTVMKANARKVRRLGKGDVIAGFAGATADAFALFERLEAKIEAHPGNLA